RRFRIASSLSARLFAEAIGADVIPLGFGDIVSSLQTGLIEAGENSVTLYSRTGIAGEAPQLTLTHHLLGMSLIVSRKRWWDGLPEADRLILERAFPPIERSRAVVRAQTAGDLAAAASLGFVVHELTAAQREEWRRATAGVTAALIRDIGGRAPEIYDLIQRGKAEFAAAGVQVPLQSSTAVPLKAPWRRSASASFASPSG
ncbi:MAG: TRAP transporter substrate-binding protein DctP, partial [Gammaproteobacteria bacterium]|nr:TRAP transporter substrate-binding protein DctP [Gammaproteobacteria bacterium]